VYGCEVFWCPRTSVWFRWCEPCNRYIPAECEECEVEATTECADCEPEPPCEECQTPPVCEECGR
jgi:hypothetical protein